METKYTPGGKTANDFVMISINVEQGKKGVLDTSLKLQLVVASALYA